MERFDATAALSPQKLKEAFDRDGVLVIKGLLDDATIERFRDVLRRLILARLGSLDIAHDDSASLDELLETLCADDPVRAMDIIRISKDLPEFYNAFTDARILEAVKACLDADVVQSVHDISQIRIDPPRYYERNFDWHQDYPYNMASQQSVTAWYPLMPIDESMGFLKVVPGSHREIARVQYQDNRSADGRGTMHSVFSLKLDGNDLEKQAVPLDDIGPGDVALFHCLLVHRSAANRGTRARWVVNPRYGDALDPAIVSRGWRTMRDNAKQVFLEVHPELVDRV